MSEPGPNAAPSPDSAEKSVDPSPSQPGQPLASAPFHSQFEYVQHGSPVINQYAQQSFDMAALAGALPSGGHPSMNIRNLYGTHDISHHLPNPGPYQHGHPMYQRPLSFDPHALGRAQQQQYMPAQYGHGGPPGMQSPSRHQGYPMQQQVPFSPVDPYSYALNAAQYSQLDPRFAPASSFGLPAVPMQSESGQYSRRGSTDTGPVPSFPRGPPRKPKQSGHALWVGNLPPAATVIDLKDHFSREATEDIESVFLISKSNCAFVNYRTEAACMSAMSRFHDSRFHGVRLVCRLRRGSAAPSLSVTTPDVISESASPEPTLVVTPQSREQVESPETSRSRPADVTTTPTGETAGPSETTIAAPSTIPPGTRVPEKYFIVKSLTAQDLEASVRNKVWATQSHNEEAFNRAYEQADNVYLIFSANKSGEYFGYARMTSPIAGEPVNLATLSSQHIGTEEIQGSSTDPTGAPQSIPTEATATAPRGRIIDDSARGTIFWEAIREEVDEGVAEEKETSHGTSGAKDGQNWGRQFSIEWMATNRLPFYRTRGLRNPWNANREVKIARDGTELEPGIGRRLVQMFHRPAPAPTNHSNINKGGNTGV